MPASSACHTDPTMLPGSGHSSHGTPHTHLRWQPPHGLLCLLLLLASWSCACQGAPFSSSVLQAEQDLQLWNAIEDACSTMLSDSQPAVPNALEELCFIAMGASQKSQGSEEKDDSKRFLFHYSKSHDSGKSDIMGQVKAPGGVLSSSGYFLFRPRNGRRSTGFR